MSDKTTPITGGCMCGAVRYEATEPPQKVGYCHCRMCQKWTGNLFFPYAMFRGSPSVAVPGSRPTAVIMPIMRLAEAAAWLD